MIARLSGTVLEKRGDAAVIDVQGVGYLVHLSLQSLGKLPPEGNRAQVLCYTHVREDALQLFGFLTLEEEELFHLLIAVSGVGPRLALNILSGMPATELASAILHGELARLTKISGVGKKTAERLVLELKDRLPRAHVAVAAVAAGQADEPLMRDDVLSALVNLGYHRPLAEKAVEAAFKILGTTSEGGFERMLKQALRELSK